MPCAQLIFLRKKRGAYGNTELSDTFLVEGKPCYLGELLMNFDQWNFQTRQEMREAIKNGPPAPKEPFGDMGKMFAPPREKK